MLKILQWKIKDFCRSGVKIVLNFSDFDWRNIARYRPGCQLGLVMMNWYWHTVSNAAVGRVKRMPNFGGLCWEGYMRCFAPVVYLHQQGIWEVWCAIGKGVSSSQDHKATAGIGTNIRHRFPWSAHKQALDPWHLPFSKGGFSEFYWGGNVLHCCMASLAIEGICQNSSVGPLFWRGLLLLGQPI